MTVPDRNITVQDGGNGVSLGIGVSRCLIGTSSSGSYNTPTSFTSPNDLASTFGYGPGVTAARYELENGGGTVVFIRVPSSVAGAITTGTPDESGSGTCACSGTPNDAYRIAVEILKAGDLGTATFKYSLDAGPDDTNEDNRTWSTAVAVPTGGTYAIPNTGLTLTFGGTAFVLGDLFWFSTTQPGYALSDLNTAMDALRTSGYVVEWVHPIGAMSATVAAGFKTKLDALETTYHQYVFGVADVADVSAIGTVTKAGTTPPDVTISGIPLGSYDVVINITTLGVLGTAAFTYSIDGGDTTSDPITTTVGTGVTAIGDIGMTFTFASGTYAVDNEYTFSTWDAPTNHSAWEVTIKTDYAAHASNKILVCAGHGECTLPTGEIKRVPSAWGQSALLAKVGLSTDLGQVEDAGALPGFLSISHDEYKNPGLDDYGFCTTRTWLGITGLYSNQGRIFCAAGSDYDLVQYRRVMNAACRALDLALARKVNKKTRVDSTTGFIFEADARALDRVFDTAVRDVTVKKGHASGLVVACVRDENLLSTRELTVDLKIIGLAYLKTLTARIGYMNPVLVPV